MVKYLFTLYFSYSIDINLRKIILVYFGFNILLLELYFRLDFR